MLTDDQYNRLLPYEEHLNTAKYGYVRGVYSKESQELSNIYKEITGKTSNPSCGYCIFVVCKYLSDLFYKYKIKYGK